MVVGAQPRGHAPGSRGDAPGLRGRPNGDVETARERYDVRALSGESRAGAQARGGRVFRRRGPPGRGGRGRLRRRRGDHRPVDCGYRAGGLPRTGGGLVRAPQVVARLDLLVHLREKPLGETIELRFAHLIRRDLHQRIVSALGPGRDRDAAQCAGVAAPPAALVGRRQATPEERLGLREHVVGAQARSVEVSHAQAGLKRRSVKLFSTTLRLDHAIAALATTGDSRTWNGGYSAPAAIGMPMTLYTKAQKRFNLIVRMMRRDS